MQLVPPNLTPPLDPDFRPPALASRAFREAVQASGDPVPVALALERSGGAVSRLDTAVFPAGHPRAGENADYLAQFVKFLLWQRGGWKLTVGGPAELAEGLRVACAPGAVNGFDAEFMTRVYQQPFTVAQTACADAPAAAEQGVPLGRHLEGYRIGFDAGASDYKAAAVVDGETLWAEEFPWDPKVQTDPDYHYQHFQKALRAAAAQLPRVDAIGVSTAGIVVDDTIAVASLFLGVPQEVFDQRGRNVWLRIREEWGVPLKVANDGDVAALAGAMSMNATRLLGVAFGSSVAAGYVDAAGNITGWLNELAFLPVDFNPAAPPDEWSGYPGSGAQYLCQTGAVRLAAKAGIEMDPTQHLAERLKVLQAAMAAGDERAVQVYRTIGVWAGYTVAHYADFYDLEHVLLMGRVTSGEGGTLLVDTANEVLRAEFPALAGLDVRLPGEEERRVGQSIAAASLPALD